MTLDRARNAFRDSPSPETANAYLEAAVEAFDTAAIDGQTFAAAGVEIGRWCKANDVILRGAAHA